MLSGNRWNNHFSTIGLSGMHEACLNLLGIGIDSEEGKALAIQTLNFMRERCKDYQHSTGNLYNLEASPAESAAYRMAKADKKLYPNIITSGTEEAPYYTNSTQLPVSYANVTDVLDHQEALQALYTGGTVVHIFLGEALPDWKLARAFIRTITTTRGIPYITLTPSFSICMVHGYILGEHEICPTCGKECEVYSRVVGYISPMKRWNKGKQQEGRERGKFNVI
jgi:ribonucleoside-triphosphate reductase